MARRNYRLVINSQFNPFSYEELMAPVLMATQAHQQLENEYGNLAAQANELYRKLNTERDKKSVATYNSYMSALDSLASQLASKGLDQSSRRNAISANTNYHKHIIPIIEGYNRRAAAEKAQQEMLSKDPTHLYARMAKDLSVDDFVDDQTLDVLSENYSGELLTQQVRTAAADILRQNRKVGGLRGMGIPYKYEQMFHNGKTEEEVVRTMMESGDADPFLQSVLNTVMDNSGIANWSTIKGNLNDPTYRRALGFAKRGLSAAIGGNNWKYFDDNYNMQLGLLRQRQAASGSGTDYQYRGMQSNPNYLYSTDKLDDIRKWADKGYIKQNKDGKWVITPLGKGALKTKAPSFRDPKDISFNQQDYDIKHNLKPDKLSDFGMFVTGGKNSNMSDDELNASLQNALNDYEDFADADAYREVVHDLYLNPAQQAAWKDRLGEKRLSRAEYMGKGKGYRTGSAANPNELDDIDWKTVTPTRIRTSRYGNTILLQDKEGNRFEYMLPTNVNQTFEQPIAKSIKDYYDLSDLASSGRKPVYERDSNGKVIGFKRGNDGRYLTEDAEATANDIAAIYAAADNAYMPANDYFMNIGGTWGVKPSDFQYGMIPTDPYNSISPWDMWQGLAGDDNNEE